MRLKYLTVLYCGVISLALLLLCTRSSILYPYNDWNDANIFFTMGKSLFNGQVVYRDVFDHKGLYLYVIYGLGYLISHNTFYGVFLLEIISGAAFLLGAFKILRLYADPKTACILLPLFGAAVFSSHSFYWGGSAEEFSLPLYIWGLYLSLNYFKGQYPRPVSMPVVFGSGMLAGLVAMIKFTGLGFFFALIMMLVFSALTRRDFTVMFKSILAFAGGMLLAFIPALIYFSINGALYDWYWSYIYVNIFLYSNLDQAGLSLWERIYDLIKILYWEVVQNLGYFIFVLIGGMARLFSPKSHLLAKINFCLLFIFMFLGLYIGGGALAYYSLPLSIFAVMGFATVGMGVEKIATGFRRRLTGGRWVFIALSGVSVGMSLFLAGQVSMNTDFICGDKESHFLGQFQKIISGEIANNSTKSKGTISDGATLLNFGCLDAGLYTVCDLVPVCRWFHMVNLPLPEIAAAQNQYIEEGLTDYVLTRDTYPEIILEKYDLIAQAPYQQNEWDFTYYLFRRK